MGFSAVFLDVDGVINDHARNPGMWDAHMGEILAPILGAEPADWGRANRRVFPRIWAEQRTWGTDPIRRIEIECQLILAGMCAELGLPPPPPESCFELWKSVDLHIARTAGAAFPFASDAIRSLSQVATLHMATGNPSWRVETLLTALNVRDRIGFPAGPDLLGIWKSCPQFYERVLERTGVDAAEALVVDDTAECIEHAMEAGARGAHVTSEPCSCPAAFHVASLVEVASLLA